MRRFAWIVTIPLTVIVILFAVMNRQPVALNLWPLPWDVDAPLFMLALGLILFGFLIGVTVMWFSGAGHRRRSRDLKRNLDDARTDLHVMKQQGRGDRTPGTAITAVQNRLPPAA